MHLLHQHTPAQRRLNPWVAPFLVLILLLTGCAAAQPPAAQPTAAAPALPPTQMPATDKLPTTAPSSSTRSCVIPGSE